MTTNSLGPSLRHLIVVASMCVGVAAQGLTPRTFATPEDAVRGLIDAAGAETIDRLLTIFGPGAQDLIDSSDAATARKNRDVFTVAIAEGWRLVDQGTNTKTLIVGNEGWPFPVPIVKTGPGWQFDAAAGKEEVLVRRIGRNELAVIGICRAYVSAQQRYAQQSHDGRPKGLFATTFRSDPGKQNGLYWPATHGQPLSPFGDLVAQASQEGRPIGSDRAQPLPFHGYYFKILTAQGSAAAGGARAYVVNGGMSAGFALLAWPAQYDATGVMTFAVNQDGVVYETDLGPDTAAIAAGMATFNPDVSWREQQ